MSPTGPVSPWWGRALALLAAVAVLVLGLPGPAGAHATLVSTDPAEGAVLEAAPDRIRFTFDEAVAGVPDGVQVFDAEGDPVASSAEVTGPELAVTLDQQVGDGTLVVVYRVVSEDGHPVIGSLSFSVGAPSESVRQAPDGSAGTTRAPWSLSLARWVGYVGLFVAAGLVAFTVLLVPTREVGKPARRRLLTVARSGAVATVLAWLVALPLTGAYQLGGGAGSLTESATWSTLSVTEYAVTAAVAVGVVVAVGRLGHVVGAVGRAVPGRRHRVVALVAAGLALVAPALTGHTRAATPEVLAVGADVLHLLAGSVWLGGLVGLAIVLPDLAGRGSLGAELLARFSGLAAGVLVALVATGSVLAWRIVGSWGALLDTGYGRLLLVKIALASAAVLVAAWNRWAFLPGLQRAARRRDRRAGSRVVVRAIVAEAGVLLAVLLMAGFLVDKSPEADRELVAADGSTRPEAQSSTLGDVTVLASLSPQTLGPNTVTIQLRDSAGAPTEFFEPPRARLLSDQVDLGTVPVTSTVAGTYTAEVVLPAPGTWRLQVSQRTSEFDNPVTTLEFAVGD